MPKVGTAKATRDRLLHAARAAIAEDGWGAVTTRGVAARAGVNPALVHYHFTSVAQMRAAAMEQAMGESAGPTGADDTSTELHQLLAVALQLQRADPAMPVVLLEGMLASLRDDSLRELVAVHLRSEQARIAELLAAQGHSPQQAQSVAALAAAVLDGLFLHYLVDPQVDSAAALDALGPLLAKPGELQEEP